MKNFGAVLVWFSKKHAPDVWFGCFPLLGFCLRILAHFHGVISMVLAMMVSKKIGKKPTFEITDWN